MQISISNAVLATNIFIIIFLVALAVSIRRKRSQGFFPPPATQELKGFAIFAIVFAHIGYYLVTDHRFLFPLSILAGVGVNLFLFLSGYGLTLSALDKKRSRWQFYRRRLTRLYAPFLIVVVSFFLLDFIVLHISYPLTYIIRSLIGFFPHANLYTDLDAPLWYFSLILFYYLIFPWLFSRKHPWLSALAVYAVSYFTLQLDQGVLSAVLGMYEVHAMAFPLGMLTAGLYRQLRPRLSTLDPRRLLVWLEGKRPWRFLKPVVYFTVMLALMFVIAYFSVYSGVGKGLTVEQNISLLTMVLIVSLFLVNRIEFRLFSLFGAYSYEIYLFHWPIMYYYDFLFRFLPAWLAMSLYLVFFLGLGWLMTKATKFIMAKIRI